MSHERGGTWHSSVLVPIEWGYIPVDDRVLADAARRLNVSLVGEPAYGFGRKSAGRTAISADGTKYWLRLSGLVGKRSDKRRRAEAESHSLLAVPKPKSHRTLDWVDGDIFWRAVLMCLAPSDAVSPNGWLSPGQQSPPDVWFTELQAALAQIRRAQTTRVVMSLEQLEASIVASYGISLKTDATDVCIAHGDLHWANLTAPELMILDWENWGWAPRGYDAARLVAYSALVPVVQGKLMRAFAEDLRAPNGQACLLLAIAMVRSDIVAGHTDPSLAAPLEEMARAIVARLANANQD